MIKNKEHKQLLRVALKLRDQLGGHHFMQYELAGESIVPGKAVWSCRDCGVRAVLQPDAWETWVRLQLSMPDQVREIVNRRAC